MTASLLRLYASASLYPRRLHGLRVLGARELREAVLEVVEAIVAVPEENPERLYPRQLAGYGVLGATAPNRRQTGAQDELTPAGTGPVGGNVTRTSWLPAPGAIRIANT